MFCQDSKCPDYLADDGEPAWCFRGGQPAQVAAEKCPDRESRDSTKGEKKNVEKKI